MPSEKANIMETQGRAEGSLDHTLCEQMASLLENLTTSGRPSLDESLMKQLKKVCKVSDAYVEHCFHLIITQLEEDHAEIRLSAFQVIKELFTRSHRFRELLVADMQEYLELTVETNAEVPLPPPKPAARLLKEQALRAMQEWHNKFGKAYKKLGLGYTYLKNCKKVDFVDIQARSDAERQRAEERQRRIQLAQAQKLNQVTEEMNEMIPELEECLTQCDNCFQLLLPNMARNEQMDSESSLPDQSSASSTMDTSDAPNSSGSGKNSKESKRISRTSGDKETKSAAEKLKLVKAGASPRDSDIPESASSSRGNGSADVTSSRSIFDIDDDEPMAGESCDDEKSDKHKSSNKDDTVMGGVEGDCQDLSGDKRTPQIGSHRETKHGERGAGQDEGDGKSDEEESEEEEDAEDVGDRPGGNVLQQHGLPSWTSISININVDADGVIIQEDTDNTDVLTTLEDQQRLLAFRYLTKINKWIETLTKMGESTKVKRLIDLKGEIKAQQDKYREMRVNWTKPSRDGKTRKNPRADDKDNDDDDDDDDDGFDEVPDKEGYESDIPEELREEYGLLPSKSKSKSKSQDQDQAGTSVDWHPIRDADDNVLDPASQAGSIAAMKEKLRKIKEEAQSRPGFHIIPAKKTKKVMSSEERKREELLKRAPVLTFGTDLAYWENPNEIKAPVILRPDTDARTWISAVDDEEVVLESAKDILKTRVMSFTGTFKPVKWKCRAPLPNGALCERMDRAKCPFHGTIIARDELGNPSNDSKQERQEAQSSQGEETSAWQDPELLRDIEGATGLDLGSSSASTSGGKGGKGKGKGSGKKGKGKAKKYPGLTDIRKINNTSRNRLEKIVMNRGSLKRVASAMNKADQRKIMDKFGNNFNYAFNP